MLFKFVKRGGPTVDGFKDVQILSQLGFSEIMR